MNYEALHDELTNPTYAALDDAAAAVRLQEPVTITQPRVITDKTIAGVLGMTPTVALLSQLQAAAGAHPELAIALTWLHEGIDVGLPATRDFLDSLAAAGLVPEQVVAGIKSLAEVQVPRWQQLELGREPDWADVAKVRGNE